MLEVALARAYYACSILEPEFDSTFTVQPVYRHGNKDTRFKIREVNLSVSQRMQFMQRVPESWKTSHSVGSLVPKQRLQHASTKSGSPTGIDGKTNKLHVAVIRILFSIQYRRLFPTPRHLPYLHPQQYFTRACQFRDVHRHRYSSSHIANLPPSPTSNHTPSTFLLSPSPSLDRHAPQDTIAQLGKETPPRPTQC